VHLAVPGYLPTEKLCTKRHRKIGWALGIKKLCTWQHRKIGCALGGIEKLCPFDYHRMSSSCRRLETTNTSCSLFLKSLAISSPACENVLLKAGFGFGSCKSEFKKPDPDPGTHQESIQTTKFFSISIRFLQIFECRFFLTWKWRKFTWKFVKARFLKYFFLFHTTLHRRSTDRIPTDPVKISQIRFRVLQKRSGILIITSSSRLWYVMPTII